MPPDRLAGELDRRRRPAPGPACRRRRRCRCPGGGGAWGCSGGRGSRRVHVARPATGNWPMPEDERLLLAEAEGGEGTEGVEQLGRAAVGRAGPVVEDEGDRRRVDRRGRSPPSSSGGVGGRVVGAVVGRRAAGRWSGRGATRRRWVGSVDRHRRRGGGRRAPRRARPWCVRDVGLAAVADAAGRRHGEARPPPGAATADRRLGHRIWLVGTPGRSHPTHPRRGATRPAWRPTSRRRPPGGRRCRGRARRRPRPPR